MVSRYRDIIETNQTNFSRQTSMMSTTSSIRNGMTKDELFHLKILFFIGSASDANVDAASTNGLTSIQGPINNNEV